MDNYVKLTRWPELQIGHVTYHFSSFAALISMHHFIRTGIYWSDVFGYYNDSPFCWPNFKVLWQISCSFSTRRPLLWLPVPAPGLPVSPTPWWRPGPGSPPPAPGQSPLLTTWVGATTVTTLRAAGAVQGEAGQTTEGDQTTTTVGP